MTLRNLDLKKEVRAYWTARAGPRLHRPPGGFIGCGGRIPTTLTKAVLYDCSHQLDTATVKQSSQRRFWYAKPFSRRNNLLPNSLGNINAVFDSVSLFLSFGLSRYQDRGIGITGGASLNPG